eukprot:m.1298385 g.1298385  ORF g.1298385 m.1298385 type:complete len:486 (+) comp24798_c1_seq73:123-1580(+)
MRACYMLALCVATCIMHCTVEGEHKVQHENAIVAVKHSDAEIIDVLPPGDEHEVQQNCETGNQQQADRPPEPFVATDEWQKVGPDQSIPPGLHVQIDMQTGEKRAKLLDDADKPGIKTQSEIKRANMKDIAKAIAEVNDDTGSDNSSSEVNLQEKVAAYVQTLQSIKDKGLEPRQDAELLVRIFHELTSVPSAAVSAPDSIGAVDDAELLELLDTLDAIVHQYDNAIDFGSMGGYDVLAASFLASTNRSASVRAAAARVVGTASQNNAAAQVTVLAAGALARLTEQLHTATHTTELKRTVYAIGAIVRTNTEALQQFLKLGGIDALSAAYSSATTPASVKLKSIALIADILASERSENLSPEPHDIPENMHSLERMQSMVIETLASTSGPHGMCHRMIDDLAALPANSDRDLCAALLQTLISVAPHCGKAWDDYVRVLESAVADVLAHIVRTAERDITDDDTDDGAHVVLRLGQTLQRTLPIRQA